MSFGEVTLMNHFYWGLQDNVNDLLSMLYPQTINEAIRETIICDNRLF